MFIKSFHQYKLPKASEVHCLNEVDLRPLEFSRMVELSESPYGDVNWAMLAFSVSNTAFRPYIDEYFSSLIENVCIGESNPSTETILSSIPVKCLFYDTSVKSPGVSSREYKFYQGGHFLGGVGVFAIQLDHQCNPEMKHRVICRIVQFSLSSGNPFKRLLIAVSKAGETSWELIFVQVVVASVPTFRDDTICTIDISVFIDPSSFVRAILNGSKLDSIPHEKYKHKARIQGSLAHFK